MATPSGRRSSRPATSPPHERVRVDCEGGHRWALGFEDRCGRSRVGRRARRGQAGCSVRVGCASAREPDAEIRRRPTRDETNRAGNNRPNLDQSAESARRGERERLKRSARVCDERIVTVLATPVWTLRSRFASPHYHFTDVRAQLRPCGLAARAARASCSCSLSLVGLARPWRGPRPMREGRGRRRRRRASWS